MPNTRWQCRNRIIEFVKLITVEPTLFLYMMAFMTTSVIEQAFFIDKACRVNHKLNSTVCDNITADEYKELNKEVQIFGGLHLGLLQGTVVPAVINILENDGNYLEDQLVCQQDGAPPHHTLHITVSNFLFKNDIAGHTGQIIMALFMGAWSDKRGRKLPLIIGLIGKLYYSVMIVVNSLQETWPVEYIAYTATLPMAFTGADVIIFAAAYTYLIDVTSQESRTMRVTLLEVCYLATMPTGIALGSYLFRTVNKSYAIMFTINSILMALAVLYSLVRLNWQSNDRQKPLSEADNVLFDFFDYRHVVTTGETLLKHRPRNRRTYLLMLILMMGLYTFQRDEKHMSFMYLQLVFKWGVTETSNFRTFLSALQDVILLTAIPLFSRVLGWRDTIIIMIGSLAHAVARVFYIIGDVGWMIYIGGAFASVGPIVAPVIRSMVSKLIANSEKGKAFSVLSVADNAIPLISGISYSKLYNATIHSRPETFFYLTMGTQLVVFLLIVYIHFRADDADLVHEDESISNICSNDESEDEKVA